MSTKVVYRKDSGKRRPNYALLFLCGALLFGFSLVNLLWPKAHPAGIENRKAAPFPAFSVRYAAGRQLAERLLPLDAGSVCLP